ncbi:IS1 family transposase [Escherichia coli]
MEPHSRILSQHLARRERKSWSFSNSVKLHDKGPGLCLNIKHYQ